MKRVAVYGQRNPPFRIAVSGIIDTPDELKPRQNERLYSQHTKAEERLIRAQGLQIKRAKFLRMLFGLEVASSGMCKDTIKGKPKLAFPSSVLEKQHDASIIVQSEDPWSSSCRCFSSFVWKAVAAAEALGFPWMHCCAVNSDVGLLLLFSSQCPILADSGDGAAERSWIF